MEKIRIGLLGLGTLGRSLVSVLRDEHDKLLARSGIDIKIIRVCDRTWQKKKEILGDIPASNNIQDIFDDSSINVIVELIGGNEPAYSWAKKSIEKSKAFVTANKALLAEHGNELLDLSNKLNTGLYFEAAIGGAMPIIQSMRHSLIADKAKKFYSILNGTSNFVLSQMQQKGIDYKTALELAKKNGYSEEDPSVDISGTDASHKLAILVALAFDTPIILENIRKKGISDLRTIDMDFAAKLGYHIVPLATAQKSDSEDLELELSIHPAMVPKTSILARIENIMNAFIFEGTYLEKMIFIAPGAGGTASVTSVISDLVLLAQKEKPKACQWLSKKISVPKDISFLHRFYLRISTREAIGVLAEISQILARYSISIATIHQYEKDDSANIIVTTHEITVQKIELACEELNALPNIIAPTVSIRIENPRE